MITFEKDQIELIRDLANDQIGHGNKYRNDRLRKLAETASDILKEDALMKQALS